MLKIINPQGLEKIVDITQDFKQVNYNQIDNFEDDEFNLAYSFPVFANVYHVEVTTFGKQRFLKCSSL